MSLKNSNDTIGNRTRDLRTCSAVPQNQLRHRVPPMFRGRVFNGESIRCRKRVVQYLYKETTYDERLVLSRYFSLHDKTSRNYSLLIMSGNLEEHTRERRLLTSSWLFVVPFVCIIGWGPTLRIFLKFGFGLFIKVWRENPNLLKINKEISDTLHEDLSTLYCLSVTLNCHNIVLFE